MQTETICSSEARPNPPKLHSRRGVVIEMAVATVSSPLSSAERTELVRCESIVARGWDTFIQVGEALAKIRNRRLYREEFDTFEAYCREKWQYGKTYAHYLIAAAEVVKHLSTIVDVPLPKAESQVRPLIGLDPDQVREVWIQAVEASKEEKVTARIVREKAATFRSPRVPATRKRMTKTSLGNRSNLTEIGATLDILEDAIRDQQPITFQLKLLAEIRGCLR